MQFIPTQQQIDAAQNLVIASAYRNLTAVDFKHIITQLLKEENFIYNQKFSAQELKAIAGVNKTFDLVKNPEHITLIDGYDTKDKPGANSDATLFFNLLQQKAVEAGYIQGSEALQAASDQVAELETALLDCTANIHGQTDETLADHQVRSQQIDALLQQFLAHGFYHEFPEAEAAYFNKYNTLHAAREYPYNYDYYSSKRFEAFKRFITIDNYLIGQNRTHDKALFANVKGLWVYQPGCYIYEIEPGKSWQFTSRHSTTQKYLVIIYSDEFYEDDDIQHLEDKLLEELTA